MIVQGPLMYEVNGDTEPIHSGDIMYTMYLSMFMF